MSGNFGDRIKQQRTQGSESRTRAAETFIAPTVDTEPTQAPAAKEPRQMLTIRVPVSMHEALRRAAFETGVSMQDQLIQAWQKQQQQGL